MFEKVTRVSDSDARTSSDIKMYCALFLVLVAIRGSFRCAFVKWIQL